jgi:hypothetical protein
MATSKASQSGLSVFTPSSRSHVLASKALPEEILEDDVDGEADMLAKLYPDHDLGTHWRRSFQEMVFEPVPISRLSWGHAKTRQLPLPRMRPLACVSCRGKPIDVLGEVSCCRQIW